MDKEIRIGEDFKDQLLREQVRLAMQHVPTMQGTSLVVALVLAYVVRNIVPFVNILVWLLMVLGIVAGRIVLCHRFRVVREEPFAGEYWEKCYLILALASGIIWGFSAILIFPSGNPGFISLFVLVIASLSTATTISHSSIKLAPTAWAGPAMLLYAVRCAAEGGEFGYILSLLILLYLFTIVRYSLTQNSSIASSIALRFQNLELLKVLQRVNELLRQDISERTKTEEAITRAKEEWEITFDSVPDLIAILDDQHRIIRMNKAMADRLGISREVSGEVKCHELIHGTAFPPGFCPHTRSLADGKVHTVEVTEDRLKGVFSVTASPLRDARGRLIGSVHLARDITQSKRAERALKVSHAFLALSQRHEELSSLVEEFLKEVKPMTQCEAVAIRVLGDDGSCVYEACEGFQQPLSVIDDWLSLLIDGSVHISPDKDDEESSGAIAAKSGSFSHNETSELVRHMPTGPTKTGEPDPGVASYESIARIAIHPKDRLVGYVYAADTRKTMFSTELLALLENAAMHMGTAIQKVLAQESLRFAHQELEKRVEERTQALSMANKMLEAEVSERRRIEEDLRREYAFREAIIANAIEGLCVWHIVEEYPYVRFTVWNRSMEEITGYTREEINRLGWTQTVYEDPAMQARAMEAMKGMIEGNPFARLERSITRADGEKRTVLISSSLVHSEEERDHVLGLMQDITELKKAENALRQSEAQFRGLVENIRVGILMMKDGHIVYQNPEQERLLGGRLSVPYPLQSLVEEVHSDDRSLFQKLCELPSSEDSSPVQAEVRLVSSGDKESTAARWVSCHCSPIEYRGEEANLIHIMDITQRKNLERMVMLREKMASLGHVAAGIAHEIRNPLSGINVYLDAIRECYRDPECAEDVVRLIQEAQRTSNKIESVIRRVLDFSRPTEVKMRPASINEIIQEAVKLVAVSLRKSSIVLELDLAPDLLQVYADAQLMEQLIINLITNAANILKGMERGSRIRITTRMKNGKVLILIEDSGPGIPTEMRERVFEPFFTTRSQGMGIGLGICKRIITDHRGDIFISTSSMGGAQFNILIPVEKRKGSR